MVQGTRNCDSSNSAIQFFKNIKGFGWALAASIAYSKIVYVRKDSESGHNDTVEPGTSIEPGEGKVGEKRRGGLS